MSPRTKQRVRQGGRVSKRVIAAQRATRAQIRAAQGEDELPEPPDDAVEVEGVGGMRPEVIQEVRIPAPDLQASDWSQSDSSSGPADNPSDSSGDSGGNESDDDDDDPSGVSYRDLRPPRPCADRHSERCAIRDRHLYRPEDGESGSLSAAGEGGAG